jgi:hypothetical protein
MTYEQAIDRLVAHDVAKWGESERAASERMNRRNYPSLGLAINRLAHLDTNNTDDALAADAKRTLTPEDWHQLRQGG